MVTPGHGTDPGSVKAKPIRERHRELTRELILETFARMVVEDGLHDVSIQQVANRVGVSHRTVYRHFKNRQDLVDQLSDWLDQRGADKGVVDFPAAATDLARAIEFNFHLLDEDADFNRALAIVTWGPGGTRARGQDRRTAELAQYLAPLTRHLSPTEAKATVALFRYVISSQAWLAFRDQFGLTGKDAGPTLAWAIRTLLAALPERRADVSTTKPEGESNA